MAARLSWLRLVPMAATAVWCLSLGLENCSAAFVRYIVAHELAHAWLHNGGWGEITDREEAADAVAAAWGYEKVPYE